MISFGNTGLLFAQNWPHHPGIRNNRVRITERPLQYISNVCTLFYVYGSLHHNIFYEITNRRN